MNAPWPAVVLAAAILVAFALQMQFDSDALVIRHGLIPYLVEQGEFASLLTSMFLHGSWTHALVNAAAALAFGVPVARLMGEHWRHAVAFFLFYIVCGVAAGGLYVLVHPGSEAVLIGASGAVSALMGAAARLLYTKGILGPVLSRTVFAFGAAMVGINLLIAFLGTAPGAGGAPVAWDVHLFGFFIGLLVIGPWAALFGRRSIAEVAREPLDAPAPSDRRGGPWGSGPAGESPRDPSPPSDPDRAT